MIGTARHPACKHAAAATHVAAVAVIAVALWLVYDSAGLNQDTIVSLDWARELAHGQLPDYRQPFAPTPHPLLTAVLGLASAAGQDFAYTIATSVSYVALATVVWSILLIGRHLTAWETGLLAAALTLLSAEATWRGIIGQPDVPAAALVLLALVVELERPRRGTTVFVLLVLAGLIRPEAWLASIAYCVYLWPSATPRRRAAHVLLAAAAPALWAFSDLVIAGDPLFSARITRGAAEALQRVTGVTEVWGSVRFSLEAVIGAVVAAGGTIGLGLAVFRDSRRSAKPAALVAIWFAAFGVLGATRLPLNPRYLLVPALLLSCFFAYAVLGWVRSQKSLLTVVWAIGGAFLLGLALSRDLPKQVDSLGIVRLESLRQSQAISDLRDIAKEPLAAGVARRCTNILTQNAQPTPWVAYAFDVPQENILDARKHIPPRAAFLQARRSGNALVHNRFYRATTARSAPPPKSVLVAHNRSWALYARRCG